MFLTVHASAGLFLGSQVASPWLAFLIGYLSHWLLDIIPHGDENLIPKNIYPETRRKWKLFYIASFDTLGIIILFFILTYTEKITLTSAVLWGMLGAVAPDYLWGLHKVTSIRILKPLHRLHNKFHFLLIKKGSIPFKYGILVQLFILTVFVWLIVYQ